MGVWLDDELTGWGAEDALMMNVDMERRDDACKRRFLGFCFGTYLTLFRRQAHRQAHTILDDDANNGISVLLLYTLLEPLK